MSDVTVLSEPRMKQPLRLKPYPYGISAVFHVSVKFIVIHDA